MHERNNNTQTEKIKAPDEIKYFFKLEDQYYRKNNDFDKLCKLRGTPLEEFGPDVRNKVLAVHKIIFLNGEDPADIAIAKDPWGNFVYTKNYKHPSFYLLQNGMYDPIVRNIFPFRAPEITEAAGGLASFGDQLDSFNLKPRGLELSALTDPLGVPELLSEIADIGFNLLHLHDLDPDFNYQAECQDLAESLGYTFEQFLILIKTKYKRRYVKNKGKKDIPLENSDIAGEILKCTIPIPTRGHFSVFIDKINEISENTLREQFKTLTIDVNQLIDDKLSTELEGQTLERA